MNVLNGGAHATNNVDFQEFMLFPIGAPSFAEALRYGAETFHTLKKLLQKRGLVTSVGDEGGFAPNLKTNDEAVEVIVEAITAAGYQPGKDIAIALDPAASEFYDNGAYVFKKSDNSRKSPSEMVELYRGWLDKYPILSLEDGMGEEDHDGWQASPRRSAKNGNWSATTISSPTRRFLPKASVTASPTRFLSSSIKSARSARRWKPWRWRRRPVTAR